MNKVGKTTRPFRYDLNQNPYNYTVEVTDIFKGLDLIDRLYKKDPDSHDDVITNLELDILECEVKWALESTTTNKASGGDGIPVELVQVLKDDAVKVLPSVCRQIWKT